MDKPYRLKAAVKRGGTQFLEMEVETENWRIEASFRIMKTDLQATPAFVWTDKHIGGHFALCF